MTFPGCRDWPADATSFITKEKKKSHSGISWLPLKKWNKRKSFPKGLVEQRRWCWPEPDRRSNPDCRLMHTENLDCSSALLFYCSVQSHFRVLQTNTQVWFLQFPQVLIHVFDTVTSLSDIRVEQSFLVEPIWVGTFWYGVSRSRFRCSTATFLRHSERTKVWSYKVHLSRQSSSTHFLI